MAALWDLDWSGPAPSATSDGLEMPVRRPNSPRKVHVNAKTFQRLAQLPTHKQGQLQRYFPAVELGRLGKSGGIRLSEARDLIMQTPPELEDKLGRKGSAEAKKKSTGTRTMEQGSLMRVFKWLDMNGDGYVDLSELYAGQHALGGHLTKEQVQDLMWEVDDDMDGRLSMDDFIDAFYRSQKDVTGFEPRRFYFMVEFFLMDRDLSGEITIDEAMSTIFQRYGSASLGRITRDFFAAAGYCEDEGEPPPGAVVTFDAFFRKFGLTKPKVRSPDQLGRSYSSRVLPFITAADNQRRDRIEEAKQNRGDCGGPSGGGMRAATAPNEATDHGRGRHKKSTPDPFWAPSWDGGDGSGRRGSSRSPPRRPKPSYARRASPRAGGMPKSKSAAILDDMLSRSRAPAARGLTAPGLPGRTMPPVTPSKQPRRPKGGTAPAAVTRKVGAAPAPELSRSALSGVGVSEVPPPLA